MGKGVFLKFCPLYSLFFRDTILALMDFSRSVSLEVRAMTDVFFNLSSKVLKNETLASRCCHAGCGSLRLW